MALFILNRGGGVDTSDANVTPATMLTGYSAYVDEAKIEGSMPNRGAVDITLAANGAYTIPDGWHNGSGRVHQSLTEQAGSTITPGTSNKLAVPAGRWVTGNVYVVGDNDLSAGNIKENVNIFGIKGTFVGTNCRDANAGAAQILTGYSGYVNQAKVSGTMPNRGAVDITLAANGSYAIPDGWHNGSGRVHQSLTTRAGATITPGTSNILAVASGRWVTGNVYVAGSSNLTSGNIKENVTIFGVKGTFVGTNCRDANAGAAQILTGYSGYVNQAKVSGTMPNRGAVDTSIGANGSYTIPNGYHNGSGKVKQSLTEQAGWSITPGTERKLACSSGRWVIGDIWCSAAPNLVPSNIKEGVTIFGVTGTFTG